MRTRAFAGRVQKELLRDPLSYIFCLGFPLVMLVIMTCVNNAIPKEANMTVFQIQYLSAGVVVFGLTFVMLFTCLSVSKDRTGAFLLRLYASPMKPSNFILGYTGPLLLISVVQSAITFIAAVLIAFFTDYSFNLFNLFLAMAVLLPIEFLFIGIGMFFGNLFNEKAAPGMCSIIISVASILGGIWMDLESLGGMWLKVCKVLPFYPATKAVRCAIEGDYKGIISPLLIVTGYAVVIFLFAVLIFKNKMKKDLK